MDNLFMIIVSNIIAASVLGIAALVVSRWCRNPHLTHAMWFLVLIKLITPPIATISVPSKWASSSDRPDRLAGPESDLQRHDTGPDLSQWLLTSQSEIDSIHFDEPLTPAITSAESNYDDVIIGNDEQTPAKLVEPAEITVADSVEETSGPNSSQDSLQPFLAASIRNTNWHAIVFTIWGAGSIFYGLLVMCRCIRFRKTLASSVLANDQLTNVARELATRVGLRKLPQIRIVDARISPLIWNVGFKPVLFLPCSLVSSLTPAQRDTILVHELVHVRRRDHWMRWLEFIVVAFCWWNPLAWMARRRLRIAEEECCDAWVIWTLPTNRQSYGQALLKTVDFLAGRQPVMGTAFGQFLFKRRIEMILKSQMDCGMTWFARTWVIAIASIVLPVAAQTAGDAPATTRKASDTKIVPTETLPQDVKSAAASRAPGKDTNSTSSDPVFQDVTSSLSPTKPAKQNQDPFGDTAVSQTTAPRSLEERVKRLEALMVRLERLLRAQTAKTSPPLPPTVQVQKLSDMFRPSESKPIGMVDIAVANGLPGSRVMAVSQDGSRIVVLSSGTTKSELSTFDRASGKKVWSSQLALPRASSMRPTENGKVISVRGGNLVFEVDAKTGKTISKAEATESKLLPPPMPTSNKATYSKRAQPQRRSAKNNLLELDVASAELKLEVAKINRKSLGSDASESENALAEIAIRQAQIDVQRAKANLDLNRSSEN